MKTKSINAWINNEIKILNKIAKNSRRNFFIIALIHIIINFATIISAILAIVFLVNSHHNTSLGVILAASSAGVVVILFFLNGFISIYRSIMKTKFYEEAINKIEIETHKFFTKQDDYKNIKAEKDFKNKVMSIADSALKKKTNTNTRKVVVKALMGGTNE